MSAFTKPALQDGIKAVGLSIVLGISLAFMPVLAVVAAPLLPIPVAFVASRHGIAPAVVAGLVTGLAVTALTGIAAGLLVYLLAAFTGLGAGICLKKGISQFRLFLSIAVLFCLALSVWAGAMLAVAGIGPVEAMQRITDEAIEPSRELYLSMGLDQQDVDDLITEARDFAMALPYLAPAALLVLSVVLSGATVTVSRRVFERFKQPFPSDFAFRELRVHFVFAYMMIAGLLCELAAPGLPETYGPIVDVVGTNLLMVSQVIFFIQGMAIASFFLRHYSFSKPKRVGIYACLALLQVTLSLISWLGLFDTWIDYRRRFVRQKKINGGKR